MTNSRGNRNAILLALSLAIALVPLTVDAKGGQPARATFETLDADGNGEVTQAEIEAHRSSRFSEADTNGDGVLSQEELVARANNAADERMNRRIHGMIERLDANGDGQLGLDEMQARAQRNGSSQFDRLDADGSGGVTREEFEAATAKHRGGKRDRSGSANN